MGVAHLVYISIVGLDDIPYSYYQRKREAEEIIASSGVPYTNLRHAVALTRGFSHLEGPAGSAPPTQCTRRR